VLPKNSSPFFLLVVCGLYHNAIHSYTTADTLSFHGKNENKMRINKIYVNHGTLLKQYLVFWMHANITLCYYYYYYYFFSWGLGLQLSFYFFLFFFYFFIFYSTTFVFYHHRRPNDQLESPDPIKQRGIGLLS